MYVSPPQRVSRALFHLHNGVRYHGFGHTAALEDFPYVPVIRAVKWIGMYISIPKYRHSGIEGGRYDYSFILSFISIVLGVTVDTHFIFQDVEPGSESTWVDAAALSNAC